MQCCGKFHVQPTLKPKPRTHIYESYDVKCTHNRLCNPKKKSLFHVKVWNHQLMTQNTNKFNLFHLCPTFPISIFKILLRHIQLSKDLCTPVDRSIFARKVQPKKKQFSEANLPTFNHWCGLNPVKMCQLASEVWVFLFYSYPLYEPRKKTPYYFPVYWLVYGDP